MQLLIQLILIPEKKSRFDYDKHFVFTYEGNRDVCEPPHHHVLQMQNLPFWKEELRNRNRSRGLFAPAVKNRFIRSLLKKEMFCVEEMAGHYQWYKEHVFTLNRVTH